ncbi:alpha/beta hydrolase [Nocardia paucivorans]|uniref:alpha/beta hydrolase n=1 Tax=Nocardia paucivorans TaxID=114259 RepID=UPI00059291CB|nr:alpha/beta hydrolase family protein [Nocardia paucivorans]
MTLSALVAMVAVVTAQPGWRAPASAEPSRTPGFPVTQTPQPGMSPTRIEVLGPRRIRLHIASAAMQRVIAVDTLIGTGSAPRPTLYLLDGVDGGETSGWLTRGDAAEFFADKPVDVVLTTGGTASMYTDWVHVDAVLGLNRWETFLTEELPPIVESYLQSTGRRAIAGVSMGAQAAMMLTQRHPGFYRGVVGLSGCYSTVDRLGQAVIGMTVASRGGNPLNLWGPPSSPEWAAHDSVLGAEALRGTRIYVSVASGAVGRADLLAVGEHPEMLAPILGAGTVLEAGAKLCTDLFAARLAELGIPATVEYLPEGIHAWPDFEEQLRRAWPTLADTLDV